MQQHWKHLIENLYQDFIDFFMPDWVDQLDTSRSVTFLNLPTAVVEAKEDDAQENLVLGLRFKDGKAGLLLLTLELKGYDNARFGQQLFEDFVSTQQEIEYKIPTAAIVVFLANSLPPIYEYHQYEFGATRIQMNYSYYVVREQYLDDLWEMVNPVAFAVAACRLRLENERHPKGRFESKKMIVQKLLQRYTRQRINLDAVVVLLKFITHALELKDHWETNFRDEMSAYIANQTIFPDASKVALMRSLALEKK
ncbi:MAG: hypothetical protein AAF806_09670 [Bacteroidota bacterium]